MTILVPVLTDDRAVVTRVRTEVDVRRVRLVGKQPLAAMFTVIVVPVTVTIAVPLPVTPLPAFGLRLALTPPSARAGPAARANIAAAPRVALATFLVVRMRVPP